MRPSLRILIPRQALDPRGSVPVLQSNPLRDEACTHLEKLVNTARQLNEPGFLEWATRLYSEGMSRLLTMR